MAKSYVPLLDQIVEAKRTETDMTVSEFFEFFCAGMILRDYQISPQDIEVGQVGNDIANKSGSDGGIDGFYVLVDKVPINDVEAAKTLRSVRHSPQIDVVVIQASTESGFTMDRILRLKDTSENIFALDKQPDQFTEKYNEALLDAIERFRAVHQSLLLKSPTFHLTYIYATRGDRATVAPDIKAKSDDFAKNAKAKILGSISQCRFDYIGAKELYELYDTAAKVDFPLKCTHVIPHSTTACVATVKLKDYFGLITETDNVTGSEELRTHLFESNVRDYQGSDQKVNKSIQDTLSKRKGTEDFWWLNNGITIIAEKIGGFSNDLVITDPQIVNGLQTSQEIYNYFTSKPILKNVDDRDVLVRIISSDDPDLQDSIIRATNAQIAIPLEFLWATDPIHREIASYFASKGLYYDRRKNSWRRKNILLSNVVGITELAQSVAAIKLHEPDHARARPSRYFQERKHYRQVFNPKYETEFYVVCAEIRKKAVSYLRKREPDKKHRNNLLYYAMMTSVSLVAKTKKARTSTIAGLNPNAFTDAVFAQALEIVTPLYESLGASDKVAKGTDLVEQLRNKLASRFGYSHKKVQVA